MQEHRANVGRNYGDMGIDIIENPPFLVLVITRIKNGIRQTEENRLVLNLQLKTRKGVVPVTGEIRVSKKDGTLYLLVKNGTAKIGKRQKYLSYGEGTKVVPSARRVILG